MDGNDGDWVKVIRGSKITKITKPYYVQLSNAYAKLEQFSADSDPPPIQKTTLQQQKIPKQPSNFKRRVKEKKNTRKQNYIKEMHDNGILNLFISKVEHEKTSIAKNLQQKETHSDKVVVRPWK